MEAGHWYSMFQEIQVQQVLIINSLAVFIIIAFEQSTKQVYQEAFRPLQME